MAHNRVSGTGPGSQGNGRLESLDGLRGLAALVVVLHHCMLTWTVLEGQLANPDPASRTWWLTYTPLHLAWAGTEAVIVFFVLSGLVLALPYLRKTPGSFRWRAYFGQRLVRLYVPVVAVLVLSAALVLAFPRMPGPDTSGWFDVHAVVPTVEVLASDALLLGGVSTVNASLWSLEWEVLFSLLLPLFVWVARRLGARTAWLVPPLLALVAVGMATGSQSLTWLPVFGIGVAMAACLQQLRNLGERISGLRCSGLAWAALTVAAVLLLLSQWWLRAFRLVAPVPVSAAGVLAVTGAALVCFLAMTCPAVRGLCSLRPARWLGTVSFSLYLVHEPILVSVSSLVGGSMRGVMVTTVAAVVLGLLAAAVFHRLVELPSQQLARAVGRRLQGAPARPASVAVPVLRHPVHAAAGQTRVPRAPLVPAAPLTRPMPLPRNLPPVGLATAAAGRGPGTDRRPVEERWLTSVS